MISDPVTLPCPVAYECNQSLLECCLARRYARSINPMRGSHNNVGKMKAANSDGIDIDIELDRDGDVDWIP